MAAMYVYTVHAVITARAVRQLVVHVHSLAKTVVSHSATHGNQLPILFQCYKYLSVKLVHICRHEVFCGCYFTLKKIFIAEGPDLSLHVAQLHCIG